MSRPDQDPSAFAWLVAFVSLALPWIGAGLALIGVWQLTKGDRAGWWSVIAGCALLVIDVLIDFVWAHPSISRTDQPDLNQRGVQLVGRLLVVEETIEAGRGKVRVGDTLWPAEGPDTAAGTSVKVIAAKGNVLFVEPA